MRATIVGLCLLAQAAAGSGGTGVHDRAASVAARARGVELGYNLDYDEAIAAFRQAIIDDPSDPTPYRLLAAAMWTRLLFQRGAVMVDDYLGEARSGSPREPPPPALDTFFRDTIRQAMTLAEARLRADPSSIDARYQIGAAAAFQATYAGTVSGSVLSGFGPARRAYAEHERVMALDPARKDAGLVVGMYRYAVSTLSAPARLLAHIAGFGGGRERGLQLIEAAAAFPSDVQTNAKFILILIYNREARYADALATIRQLQRQYPRNRLLWLEEAGTALRAGRPVDARHAIEMGLAWLSHDTRPRARGEEARWHLYYGTALVALRDAPAAERELGLALSIDSRDSVHGRAHKELGKLADLAGDRPRALAEYRMAARLCDADRDSDAAAEARRLIKEGYR